jgi:hypothetical protein
MTSAQRAAFFKGREVMHLNDSDTANNNERTISGTRTTSEREDDETTAKTEVTDNRSVSAQCGQKTPKKSRASLVISRHKIASNKRSTNVVYVQTQDYLAHSRIEVDSRADTVCAGK